MCRLTAVVVEAYEDVTATMICHRGNVPRKIRSTDIVREVEPILQLHLKCLPRVVYEVLQIGLIHSLTPFI